MRSFLARVLLDSNQAKKEILLILDEIQLYMKNLDRKMKWIDDHLNLPPDLGSSPHHGKEPINMDPLDSS